MDAFTKWAQKPETKAKLATAKTSAWVEFTKQFPNADKTKFVAQTNVDQQWNITAEVFFKEGPGLFKAYLSSTGGRFGTSPIRAQYFKFGPIRAPYLGHMTRLAARSIFGDWYQGIRGSAVVHGIEAGTRNDVTVPEMTSWQPEVEKKSRDTVIDRFNKTFLSSWCRGIVNVLQPFWAT